VGALVYAEVVAGLGVLVVGGCLLVKVHIVKSTLFMRTFCVLEQSALVLSPCSRTLTLLAYSNPARVLSALSVCSSRHTL
jgi:hypothetical protein